MIAEIDKGAETKPRKRKPKAKQEEFQAEGMAQKKIAEIEECAERYVDARDERQAAMLPEKKEKSLLMALMKKHEVTIYKFDGKIVELIHKDETVKVRKVEDDDSDVEVGEDDGE